MASLGTQSFTTNITNTGPSAITGIGKIAGLSLVCQFTATGGGGATTVYVETSLDDGSTWYDVAAFGFTTPSAVKYANLDGFAQIAPTAPTTGTLTADTCKHGLLGDRLRYVVTTTGTAYSSGSKVDVFYQTR
jgi:hypothetical protein